MNKEARDLWRGELRAPYLLAFCRFLFAPSLPMPIAKRYLDWLPVETLDVVPESNPFPTSDSRRADTIETIQKERCTIAKKLNKANLSEIFRLCRL